MPIKDRLTPEDIIKRMEVLEHPNVYFVGRKGLRLTFLSQQQRALNLIWALNEVNKFDQQTRIIVVGAGLAGLTAAFAAYHLSAKITLIESKPDPMHLQHGCRLRFIHPNILDWPKEGSDISFTDLPCMNWGAGMADDVAETILSEWCTVQENIDKKFGYEVRKISVDSHTELPRIFAEGGGGNFEQECDYLILAIGFGLEKTITSIPFLSYWENDNFARPLLTEPIPRRYLVTGCGDGGLIDAIRLRIRAFDHENFVYDLAQVDGLKKIKDRLPQIDDKVARTLEEDAAKETGQIATQLEKVRHALGNKFDEVRTKKRLEIDLQGNLLEQEYRKLIIDEAIPEGLTKLITSNLRTDTIVFLNSPYSSPLSLGSSILNRFLVFLLRLHGGLRYRAGEVAIKPIAGDQLFRVSFIREQFPTEELEVHQVVVRHGPVSIIDRLFPKHIADDCRAGAKDLNDPTRAPQYDQKKKKFLAKPELIARKEAVLEEHRIRTNPLAARKLVQAAAEKPPVPQPTSASVGGDVMAFSEPFLIDEAFEPFPQTFKSEHAANAPLAPGTAIQNIGPKSSSSTPASSSKGSGTLGCFVETESGDTAILTTASALGGRKAKPGDRICVAPASDTPLNWLSEIGTISNLILPVPSSPRAGAADRTVKFNQYEAAVVTLDPGIMCTPDLQKANPSAPSLKTVFELPSSGAWKTDLIGEKVLKVGAKTGLTRGRIESVFTTCTVRGEEEHYWYESLFSISGPKNKSFSAPGDGGALVVKEDGTILGLIIASLDRLSFACFIAPILEALNCRVI